MEQPQTRIQTHAERRDSSLGFEYRVEVIEDCICRINGTPWRGLGNQRMALAECQPVRGYPFDGFRFEIDWNVFPSAPVDVCGLRLGASHLRRRVVLSQRFDQFWNLVKVAAGSRSRSRILACPSNFCLVSSRPIAIPALLVIAIA